MVRVQKGMPVALSRFDLSDAQELLVHSCEDCACPVSNRETDYLPLDAAQAEVIDDTARWVRGREITEIHLDEEHRALFNPLGRGGVVVVNQAAQQILDHFRRPVTVGEVRTA